MTYKFVSITVNELFIRFLFGQFHPFVTFFTSYPNFFPNSIRNLICSIDNKRRFWGSVKSVAGWNRVVVGLNCFYSYYWSANLIFSICLLRSDLIIVDGNY